MERGRHERQSLSVYGCGEGKATRWEEQDRGERQTRETRDIREIRENYRGLRKKILRHCSLRVFLFIYKSFNYNGSNESRCVKL